jgi:flagellar basal-body rod protein FlgB
MTTSIFDKTRIPLLSKALDVYGLRQRVISNNLSNISTPGFKRSEVTFEQIFRQTLEKPKLTGRLTRPDHIPIGAPEKRPLVPGITTPNDPVLHSGVNNVDIDQEMAELAKNQIRYSFATRLIRGNFTAIKSSITGRIE